MKFYVYELLDIRCKPLNVFYVGKGTNNRMYKHVTIAKNGKNPNNNSKLGNRIRAILNDGYTIKYNKIFLTDDEEEAYNFEVKTIAEYGLENLCNLTPGGEGMYKGYKHTINAKQRIGIAAKERMTGKVLSKHIRKKISKTLTNRKLTKEHIKNMSKALVGRIVTEKTRKKISRANTGKKRSKEARVNMSKAQAGRKHTEITKEKIRKNHARLKGENAGNSKLTENDVLSIRHLVRNDPEYCLFGGKSKLARKFNVSSATITKIITRTTWKHV